MGLRTSCRQCEFDMITVFFNALGYFFLRQTELINHLLIEMTKINHRRIDACCVFTSHTERENFSVSWWVSDKYWQLCQSCLPRCIATLVPSTIEKVVPFFRSIGTDIERPLEAISFDRLYKSLEVVGIDFFSMLIGIVVNFVNLHPDDTWLVCPVDLLF